MSLFEKQSAYLNLKKILKYVIPILLVDFSFYLNTIIFLLIFLVLSPIIYGAKDYKKTSIYLFFTLIYLLPYDFMSWQLNMNVNDIIGNSFVAGIPLYISFFIPSQIGKIHVERKLLFILFIFILAFIVSTVSRVMLYSLFNASNRVSPDVAINFFNAIIIALISFKAFDKIEDFKDLTYLLITLGLIVSCSGILQYFFDFYFFSNRYVYAPNERLSIISLPDPVDLFPFIIVPFAFGIQYIKHFTGANTNIKISIFVILFSSVFTWARWGSFVLLLIIFFSLLSRANLKYLLITIGLLVLIYFTYSLDVLYQFATPLQQERLGNDDNLLGRFVLWGLGLAALQNNWLWGVGLGNAAAAAFAQSHIYVLFGIEDSVQRFAATMKMQTLHSFFLEWILSMGVLAIPGIVLLFTNIWKNFLFIRGNTKNNVVLHLNTSIVLSTISLSIFYLQNTGSSFYFYFIFLSLSALIRNKVENNLVNNETAVPVKDVLLRYKFFDK